MILKEDSGDAITINANKEKNLILNKAFLHCNKNTFQALSHHWKQYSIFYFKECIRIKSTYWIKLLNEFLQTIDDISIIKSNLFEKELFTKQNHHNEFRMVFG